MQFTLGMPFLGVLGKFYRNLKGLKHCEVFYYHLLEFSLDSNVILKICAHSAIHTNW